MALASRLQLGDAAVLTVREAARQLPMRETEARSWVRQHVPLRRICDTEVVIWGDVLAALRRADEPPQAEQPPARAPRRRSGRLEAIR